MTRESPAAARIRALCTARGITITRRDAAFVLTGPGVSILVTDLAMLAPIDLEPGDEVWVGRKRRRQRRLGRAASMPAA